MKKTILMYESDRENKESTIKAEGNLLELIAGAVAILKNVSETAAKALDRDPANMVLSICNAVIDMLMDEKGEENE